MKKIYFAPGDCRIFILRALLHLPTSDYDHDNIFFTAEGEVCYKHFARYNLVLCRNETSGL